MRISQRLIDKARGYKIVERTFKKTYYFGGRGYGKTASLQENPGIKEGVYTFTFRRVPQKF